MTLSVPKVWSDWWTTRANFTGFYNEFYAPVQAGILDNNTLTYQLHVSNEFTLPKDWTIEISGNYSSRNTWAFFTGSAIGNVDAGINKKIGKNGQIKVGVTDIFLTQRNRSFVNLGDIQLTDKSRFDTRRVSANWNFGNKKVKGTRNRKTASEDERERL